LYGYGIKGYILSMKQQCAFQITHSHWNNRENSTIRQRATWKTDCF
jgi:hypothetical protein